MEHMADYQTKKAAWSAAFDLLTLLMCFIGRPECLQFYNASLVADPPGDDLPSVLAVVGFDDRPAAVRAVMTAPLEVMEITCSVDLFDDGIAIVGFMR